MAKIKEVIKNIPTVLVDTNKIDLDSTNPNVMNESQMKSLEREMKKRGFSVDVWLRVMPKGRYKMIDGEHRFLVLKNNNEKQIPAKIFKVSDIDSKLLRQYANKFRGTHDFEKDALEFKAIYDDKKLNELADMLAQPVEEFQQILEQQFAIPESELESSLELGYREWQGMPRFLSKNQDAYHIMISFEKKKDIQDFAILIGQTISDKTKSIWFPAHPVLKQDRQWKNES